MKSRREFIRLSALATALFSIGKSKAGGLIHEFNGVVTKPVVVSTWQHGLAANREAWKILTSKGQSLDAVEKGVRVAESDPNVRSVGYGGIPDRDGHVTLDACIMDPEGNCGSVAFLENIMNPVSVARLVMEKTPHVMIVGEGALKFALDNGFKKENLLTPESEKDWKEWLKINEYKPVINFENHDTIGMLAIDNSGNISGACTTSGLSFKMHGRVGDSPIIGAGLFVDNEVGGACATGIGEAVIKISGSHTVVEMMRLGKSPEDACKQAIERIISKQKNNKDIQVGFLALNKNGEYGAFSIQKGFNYAVDTNEIRNKLIDSDSHYK
ncbi:MAG: N(4)-(beta-N-acetylglucosaminyl)-L-asparaginase [Bacteroidia bacterium]|nr:N(4)-(beta-N-acetylglucosaminyl)-L-asparaginase [Bacteroidia bacterium]